MAGPKSILFSRLSFHPPEKKKKRTRKNQILAQAKKSHISEILKPVRISRHTLVNQHFIGIDYLQFSVKNSKRYSHPIFNLVKKKKNSREKALYLQCPTERFIRRNSSSARKISGDIKKPIFYTQCKPALQPLKSCVIQVRFQCELFVISVCSHTIFVYKTCGDALKTSYNYRFSQTFQRYNAQIALKAG